jgi:hypothetical protein
MQSRSRRRVLGTCGSSASAKRALPEVAPGGRWELSIEHVNSECSSAVHVLLFTHGTTTPIASEVLDAEARTAGTAHVVFSAPALPVELRLYAEGGLHCCGTTTVGSIVLRRSR